MIYKFFDTNAIWQISFDNIDFQPVISSITFQELRDIQTAIKNVQADIAIDFYNKIELKLSQCEVWEYKEEMLSIYDSIGINHITNELKSLACAFSYDYHMHPDETVFVTCSIPLAMLANRFFGEDSIEIC